MAQVIRAKVLGFCMGVRRAVDLAVEAAEKPGPHCRVCTLGPLIHNPRVLEGLRSRGVEVLDEIPHDGGERVLIIRAHGIPPALEEDLKGRNARLIDATCPRVKLSQLKARRLYREGFRIFLAGEKRHGEIIAIQGYAPSCVVVGTFEEAEEEAAKLREREPGAKTALVGQTTISPEEYGIIASGIRKYFPGLHVVDTICAATRDRQESLRELLPGVEGVVIAGGKDSANTRRLLAIAREAGKPAWLVEGPREIPEEAAAYAALGLSAGASTPGELIDEIEEALRRL
jgi:4-hydroxy-3-methylbut-2-enyl diphosphate reductase